MKINCFDKILNWLSKKKEPKTIVINHGINYYQLICDWNYYHLAITYKINGKYEVLLEDLCHVFNKCSDIGTYFWTNSNLDTEEDVINYIKYKMRYKK